MRFIITLYIFIFLLGISIGSFLNVCIYRIPVGKSVISPPSSCMKCGARLRPYELVPILSFIYLKGRCRHCGERISPRYVVVEALTGIVFLAFFLRYGVEIEFLASAFLMSVLIAVFFIDIDHRLIPDGLVITGLIGGMMLFIYNIFAPVRFYMDRVWWNPLVGAFTGSGILFIVALLGILIYKSDDAMGMGDVKIFIPIGLFLGWRLTLLALVMAVFIAGFVGLFLIIAGLKKRKDTIPFGPFIVAGVLIAFLCGNELLKWYI